MLSFLRQDDGQKIDVADSRSALDRVFLSKVSGFHEVPIRDEIWNVSEKRGAFIRENFSRLAILGIGGSSLGARVFAQMFDWDNRIVFFENVDSVTFSHKLKKLGDLQQVHWLVISKSGRTLETLSQWSIIARKMKSQQLSFADSVTVISDPVSNPLTDWARQNQVECLPIPLDIGGRFSVLTPVGLVPAKFLGVDLARVREGSRWANQQRDLAALASALTLSSWKRGELITVFFCYGDVLQAYGLWMQQLWAESLSKTLNRAGRPAQVASTPLPLVGANDQHSILQQLMEGQKDKFIWFVSSNISKDKNRTGWNEKLGGSPIGLPEFMSDKTLDDILLAERMATSKALSERGVFSLSLELCGSQDHTVGALLQFSELVVATLGEILDVNTFDQPGVELGKRLAMEILERGL